MELTPAKINEIQKSIQKGLDFLSRNQLPTGEFKSYRSTHPQMKEDCEFDSSPFPTALIAYSLSFSDSEIAKEMIDNSIRFFLSEMEGKGVWRYWTKQHPYHKNIPPDLDDIVCVSSVLKQNNIEFPNNEKIILSNRNSQGLFYTWIVPRLKLTKNLSYMNIVLREALKPVSLYYFWKLNESEPDDIDCVVNANVLYYLGERKETEAVIDYLIQVVKNNKEEYCDKWHLSRFNLYYFLSKNYFAGIKAFDPIREICVKKITSSAKENGIIGENILETALSVCSLLNWKSSASELHKAISVLLAEQSETGCWGKFPFYYGGPKKYFGWGSEEITTGFCLEALIRYLDKVK